jgi:replicative DNA helicase
MNANFTTAADLIDAWRDDLLTGKPPTLYPAGTGDLSRIELGPGLVTLLGGPPGAGKTAFTMQLTVDALRLSPALRVLVCNVECTPAVLLDRQLARLSGIDAERIRKRQIDASHGERLDAGLRALDDMADRLAFVRPPFDLANVAAAGDAHDAGLILLDYIQRIRPPGNHNDRRGSVDASMDFLRQFADAGIAVVVVAAVARQKDKSGRTSYAADALSLASFRESSELEFGADDAYILAPTDKPGEVALRHLKARHSQPRDLRLTFDGVRQSFSPAGFADSPGPAPKSPSKSKLRKAIFDAWNSMPADDDERRF